MKYPILGIYLDMLVEGLSLSLIRGKPYLTKAGRLCWPIEVGLSDEDDFYLKYGVFK